MPHIEVYTDAAGEHRWRRVSVADVIADSGEGYKNEDFAREMATKQFPDDEIVKVESVEPVEPPMDE